MTNEAARQAVEAVFRDDYGRIVASLIRHCEDFELAEEALQDALARALTRWPRDGVPDQPRAWVTITAKNRLIDVLRREKQRSEKYAELLPRLEEEEFEMHEYPDDRLRLIFTCCHPALNHEARVALTLNTLCGLGVSEIARAFLVRDQTLAQRLVRAKRKIREARIPYRVPPVSLLPERLPAVLAVVYLVFNEGYAASSGDELIRRDLCVEGIRLARLLAELLPDEPEVHGLLALLLLSDSRRDARSRPDGSLVLLEDQDRSLWDQDAIREGIAVLEAALRAGRPGPYQLQAAIAAVHAEAERPSETDWRQIRLLYDRLLDLHPSAVVALNRAVAVAMLEGPEAGLAAVDEAASDGELDDYVYLHSTRADFFRRLARTDEARQAYERALALVTNAAEREFLSRRLAEL